MEIEPGSPSLGSYDVAQESVGTRLRKARLAKKIELADIARETRVPQRHLVAIEADQHDLLPALPYTIGFVRALARAVDLPADDVAAQFRAETTKTQHIPQTVPIEPVDESRVPSRAVVIGSLVALLFVGLLITAFALDWFGGNPPPPPVVQTASEPQLVEEPAVAADATMPPADLPPPADAATVPTDPALAPAAQAAAAAPATAAIAGGPVVITATEDAWIKIYDQPGQPAIMMGILKAGDRYEVPATLTDPKLWTGKAGALQLTVGGKPIPPLGGIGQTVRDVSLTPAALLARAG